MRGFEVVVRPVVLPNIRPAPAQSLPPQDDPDKGFAVIRGNGAKQIDLSSSWSSSTSMNQRRETQRQVDEVRIYQKDDDGNVNKKNFVDLQIPNKIWMEGPPGDTPVYPGTRDPDAGPPGGGDDAPRSSMNRVEIERYRPVQEADNIEIKKHNHILRSGQEVAAGP